MQLFLQIFKYSQTASRHKDVSQQHPASLEGGGVRIAARSMGQGNAAARGGRATTQCRQATPLESSWVTPVRSSQL